MRVKLFGMSALTALIIFALLIYVVAKFVLKVLLWLLPVLAVIFILLLILAFFKRKKNYIDVEYRVK